MTSAFSSTVCTITLAAALLLTGGCKSVDTVERTNPRATPEVVDAKRLSTDPGLKGDIKLINVVEQTLPDGTLKIQADVQNVRRTTRRFNYRIEWIDQHGMLVQTPTTTWKPASLRGGESMSVPAVAPGPGAVDFRLKIVEAR